MSFKFGFYNAIDHDRLYSAEDFGEMFDGLITDGIYSTIGDVFAVVPGSGLSVKVRSGRAWFNHTWSVNTADYPIQLDLADLILPRIDAIVIEIDTRVAARANSLKKITGIPAINPNKPTLTNSDGVYQYPLAYITIPQNAERVDAINIENCVGNVTPFCTGILKSVSISELWNQWEAQFSEWFSTVQAQLEGNVVTNLQNQINQKVNISDKATAEDIINNSDNKWMTPALVNSVSYSIGDIIRSNRKLSESEGWLRCNGRYISKAQYPALVEKLNQKYAIGFRDDGAALFGNEPIKKKSMDLSSINPGYQLANIGDTPYGTYCGVTADVLQSEGKETMILGINKSGQLKVGQMYGMVINNETGEIKNINIIPNSIYISYLNITVDVNFRRKRKTFTLNGKMYATVACKKQNSSETSDPLYLILFEMDSNGYLKCLDWSVFILNSSSVDFQPDGKGFNGNIIAGWVTSSNNRIHLVVSTSYANIMYVEYDVANKVFQHTSIFTLPKLNTIIKDASLFTKVLNGTVYYVEWGGTSSTTAAWIKNCYSFTPSMNIQNTQNSDKKVTDPELINMITHTTFYTNDECTQNVSLDMDWKTKILTVHTWYFENNKLVHKSVTATIPNASRPFDPRHEVSAMSSLGYDPDEYSSASSYFDGNAFVKIFNDHSVVVVFNAFSTEYNGILYSVYLRSDATQNERVEAVKIYNTFFKNSTYFGLLGTSAEFGSSSFVQDNMNYGMHVSKNICKEMKSRNSFFYGPFVVTYSLGGANNNYSVAVREVGYYVPKYPSYRAVLGDVPIPHIEGDTYYIKAT